MLTRNVNTYLMQNDGWLTLAFWHIIGIQELGHSYFPRNFCIHRVGLEHHWSNLESRYDFPADRKETKYKTLLFELFLQTIAQKLNFLKIHY